MTDAAAAQAYRALEAMIVTLELAPGSVTTEGALIDAVGFGRTPVREAIQRLAWEGLVEVRPRAGLAIAPLHAGDWLKVIDARRGVETVLAAGAARFLTPTAEHDLRKAAEAMTAAAGNADARAFLLADKAMDEAIAQSAENAFAARVAAPLQAHSRRFWFRFRSAFGLSDAAIRHRAMADAIMERNETEARTAAATLMDLLWRQAQAALR